MALIYRGDRVYCYTSARGPDGRVRGVYLGAGLAELDTQGEIDLDAAGRRAAHDFACWKPAGRAYDSQRGRPGEGPSGLIATTLAAGQPRFLSGT